MKIKDIPGLKEQVLNMLPVTQARMWKALGISSKDGSELIKYMLNDKVIKRTITTIEGKRTFLLESENGNPNAKKIDYSVMLSGDKFSPCCRCEEDCVPVDCVRLTEWVIGK
jgi:DNA-binding Lrp family transcriptional regulator